MTGAPVRPVQRVAVIGAGVIGRSWAALFLAKGLEVTVHDPGLGAESRTRAGVTDAWPALRAVGAATGEPGTGLHFADDPAEAVRHADYVQENGPEDPESKARTMSLLDEHAPASTVIASSSSGLTPSNLQRTCVAHPERVLVGHPFNPAHLIPLVEVVSNETTATWAVTRAIGLYRHIGKSPIHVRRELPGHVANRLQAALWREAYSLVERGVVSVADVDTAIAMGPGLRWALLGPIANQHLSGGAGGLAHVLDHLGPPAQRWMDDLGEVRMTPELAATLVAGVEEELRGTDETALVAERDALLVQLLRAKGHTAALP
jgi:carnitine 3-dehydrogenase